MPIFHSFSLKLKVAQLITIFTRTTYVTSNPVLPIHSSRTSQVASHEIAYVPADGSNEQGSQLAKFISVWCWTTHLAALPRRRTMWWAEFADRAKNEYEYLGHIIDWLRILSKNSEILFLLIERHDEVIELLKRDHDSKKYSVQPGLGFGDPPAK
jgi:hypothetical protein